MPPRRPVVSLTTDFGTADPFVASMKGVILSINPDAVIVDISHDVESHDVLEGAFRLRCAFGFFPPETAHVVVVDPGVGSERRPLLMVTRNHRFLAPDNGVLSLVPEVEEVREVFHVTCAQYLRPRVSNTFHGRDVFAPAAAWLTRGIDPSRFGDPVSDWKRLDIPRVHITPEGILTGVVLAVDRFGNVITDIPRSLVDRLRERAHGGLAVVVGDRRIEREVRAYHEIPGEEPAYLFNSNDLLEIALDRRSAARTLGMKRGDRVRLEARSAGDVP